MVATDTVQKSEKINDADENIVHTDHVSLGGRLRRKERLRRLKESNCNHQDSQCDESIYNKQQNTTNHSVPHVCKDIKHDTNDDDKTERQDILELFRTAIHRTKKSHFTKLTSTIFHTNDNNSLHEYIVDSSITMPLPISMGLLSLEENSSVILKDCRMIAKEICKLCALLNKQQSSSTSSKQRNVKSSTLEEARFDCETSLDVTNIIATICDFLCLVVHGLRSILFISIDDISKKETMILLFYHIIQSADVTCRKCITDKDQFQYGKLSAIHSFCAADALNYLFKNYTVKLPDSHDGYLTLTWRDESQKVSGHSQQFALPCPYINRKTKRKLGSYTFDQVSSMTVNILISLLNITVTLWQCKETWLSNQSGQVFGKSTFRIADMLQASNAEMLLTDFFNDLIQNLIIPWIRSLKYVSQGSALLETIPSFCKKVFKMLWNTAKIVISPHSSILIQKDAIKVLLLYNEKGSKGLDNTESIISTLIKNNFEEVCTYAWKAAEVYFNRTITNPKPLEVKSIKHESLLNDFHRVIGASLDRYATEYHKEDCTSYIEYCAYRALHMGEYHPRGSDTCVKISCSCLFSKFHFPYAHHCDRVKDCSTNQFILALFFLIRTTKAQILDNSMAEILSLQLAKQSLEKTIEQQDGIIRNASLWHYKLLSALNLPNLLNSSISTNSFSREIVLLSEIVMRFVNPLCKTIILDKTNQVDTQQRNKVCGTLWQGGNLAISIYFEHTIYNKEIRSTDSNNHISFTETYVNDFVSILMCNRFNENKNSYEMLDNVAQSLFRIGRKQFDAGDASLSIAFLLYAMKLFLHLLPKAAESSLLSMQLSNRFAFIGKVYKVLQNANQAIISMAYALLFHTFETSLSASNTDIHYRLISGTVSYVQDIFCCYADSDSDDKRKRKSLMRDFITMINNSKPSLCSNSSKKDNLENNLSNLLKSSLERWGYDTLASSRLTTISNTVDILVLISESNKVPVMGTSRTDLFQVEKVMIGLELMHQVGCLIQDTRTDKQYLSLEVYRKIFSIVEESIWTLAHDEYNVDLISALNRLAASSFLVSRGSTSDFFYWVLESRNNGSQGTLSVCNETAIEFIATNMLDSLCIDLNSDMNILLKSVHFCIVLYRIQLSSQGGANIKSSWHHTDIASVERLVDVLNSTSSKSSINNLSKTILKIYLVKMYIVFDLDGEEMNAARLAKLISILFSDQERSESQWAISLLLSSFSTMTAVPLALADLTSKNRMLPDEIEYEGSLLRLHISKAAEIHDFERLQKDMVPLFHQIQRTDDEHLNSAIYLSGKTTAFLAIAEFEKRRGHLESALELFKHCFATCKTLLPLIGQAVREASNYRDLPVWKHQQLWLLKVQCLKRQQGCLERIAVLHFRLGNRRKAAEYGIYAISVSKSQHDFMGINSDQKFSFRTTLHLSRKTPCRRCCEVRQRRFILNLLAAATPADIVSQSFSKDDSALSNVDLVEWMKDVSTNLKLERLADGNAIFRMLYCGTISTQVRKSAIAFRSEESLIHQIASLNELFDLNSSVTSSPFIACPKVMHEVHINHAGRNLVNIQNVGGASDELKDILSAPYCSTSNRVRILYFLGTSLLERIRRSGYLRAVWDGTVAGSPFCTEMGSAVENAKNYFTECITLLGSENSTLARNSKRSLALLWGPGYQERNEMSTTLLLVNSAIGIGSQRLGDCLTQLKECTVANDSHGIFANALMDRIKSLRDNEPSVKDLINDCKHHLIPGWKFVSATICPPGELLLTSIEHDSATGGLKQSAACIFPDDESSDSSIYNELLVPLDEIIKQSEEQLSKAPPAASSDGKHESRLWWEERASLNSALQQLLENFEAKLFRNETAREIFSENSNFETETDCISGRNLHSMFDAAFLGNTTPMPKTASSVDSSNIEKLRRDLSDIDLGKNGLSTESPIHACSSNENSSLISEADEEETSSTSSFSECIFLILDEDLQRFPFESLPCLNGRSVCRLPSLALGLQRISKFTSDRPYFNADTVSYILDPESNLEGTRERLSSWIQSPEGSRDNWNGIVGSPPPPGFMENALTTKNGLLLYFGHGNGKQYFSQRRIETLQQPDSESGCTHASSILASIVLMGCSSGKLASVNRSDVPLRTRIPFHYEPEGLALSYLLSGSPCVVANLWDVTDRDIDRFSIALLSGLNDVNDLRSICHRVSQARHACKMRYIVGGAPVCYGFPVVPRSATF